MEVDASHSEIGAVLLQRTGRDDRIPPSVYQELVVFKVALEVLKH